MTSLFSDHLSLDAVVAFADGELGMVAYQRAAAHVARCPSCAAEVAEQTSARDCLRSASAPKMPGSLFDQLRSIPVALPATPPAPPAEPSDAHHRGRRFRFGAGFLVAGIAAGALAATAAVAEHPDPAGPASSPGSAPSAVVSPARVDPLPGPGVNPVVHRPG